MPVRLESRVCAGSLSAVGAKAARSTRSSAIRSGNQANRLELHCAHGDVSAEINGVRVATIENGSYAEGQEVLFSLALATFTPNDTVDARFDNLVVTQR
jgi:hypothetical protein